MLSLKTCLFSVANKIKNVFFFFFPGGVALTTVATSERGKKAPSAPSPGGDRNEGGPFATGSTVNTESNVLFLSSRSGSPGRALALRVPRRWNVGACYRSDNYIRRDKIGV